MCQTVNFESKNAVFCLPREQILGCRSLGLTFRQWKTDENPLIFYVGKTVKRCECNTADYTFCSWLPPCLYLPVNNSYLPTVWRECMCISVQADVLLSWHKAINIQSVRECRFSAYRTKEECGRIYTFCKYAVCRGKLEVRKTCVMFDNMKENM